LSIDKKRKKPRRRSGVDPGWKKPGRIGDEKLRFSVYTVGKAAGAGTGIGKGERI